MGYALSFRISYTDPFGNQAFYHQTTFSKERKKRGDMVSVKDTRTGLTSPYLGEIHCVSSTLRPEDDFRFKLAEGI